MLKGKTIVLGVTGGIAAYKSPDIVSRLRKENANVEVIMTEGAKEFVTPLTFQTMSNNVVHHRMFNEITSYDVEHISLAKKADLILIAPATANTIGKIANGIADNLLTTVVMASKAKVLIAPAMNTVMYENKFTQENMKKLEDHGYYFINPASGLLACGDVGKGKMSEPWEIVEYIKELFIEKDLKGLKILVTAGPTREPLDPVRYISNRSSGKMGYSIAKAALERGAEVVLVTGPTNLDKPLGAKIIEVNTTKEMKEAIEKEFNDIDILIKSAAPSDFRVKNYSENKIKKEANSNELKLELIKNPDIIKSFGKKKKSQILVGFAAETENLIKNAKGKLKNKNLDLIVANDVTQRGAGFDLDTNIVTLIDKEDRIMEYPMMNKKDLANKILDEVKEIFNKKNN